MEDQQIQNLLYYIRQQLGAGQTADVIHTQLQAAGWPEDAIQSAFYTLQASILPAGMKPNTGAPPSAPATVPQANGQRRGRIRTGWQLFKQSMGILGGNKYLLRYLLMTGVWVLSITAVFVVIYIVYAQVLFQNEHSDELRPLGYVLAAIDYVLIYFFINLYAAGLTANVFDIFKGHRKPYGEYMHVARSKAGPLFVFSLLQATVGMFLQYVVERIRFIGWLLAWFLGTLWSLGTLFVVPIIVSSDKPSGLRSVKESVVFFKQTWGENITAKVTVNTPLALINLGLFGIFMVLLFTVMPTGNAFLIFILVIMYILAVLTLAIIGSFANSMINIALFYFATQHEVPPAYSADLLNQVFVKHKRHRFFGKNEPASTS